MLYSLVLIFASIIISLMSGVLIFQSQRETGRNTLRYLGIAFAFISLWGITSIINSVSSTYTLVLISTKLSYVANLYMLLFLIPFIESIYNPKAKVSFPQFLLMVVISLLIVFTDNIVANIEFNPSSGSNPILGNFFVIYGLCIVPYVVVIFRNVVRAVRLSSGETLLRFKYVLVGLSISAIGVLFTGILLPLVKINTFVPFGYIWTLPTVLLSGYSFLFNRLFDIKYVVGKFITNLIFVISIFLIFNVVVALQLQLWGDVFSPNAYVSGFIIAAIFIVVARYGVTFVTSVISSKIIYSNFDPNILLTKFREAIENDFSKNSLVNKFDEYLGKAVRSSGRKYYLIPESVGKKSDLPDIISIPNKYVTNVDVKTLDNLFSDYRNENSRYITLSDIKTKPQKKFFVTNSVSGVGIISRGYFLTGDLNGLSVYTVNTLNYIEKLIEIFSIALFRADLYEDLEVYNKALEVRVEDATKQLRNKINDLQEARQKETDMIDIMGHELRTPATIVNLNMDMMNALWERTKTKIKDKETDDKFELYKGRINDGVDREIKLINILLASAKLDGKRLILNKEPVDIIHAIENGILAQQKEADHKGLLLTFNKPKAADKYPMVLADKVRVQEIIDNLINNAVKYTEKGSVKVGISRGPEFVEISVSDTGFGIPKNEVKNLGKKFYRVGQHTSESKTKNGVNVVRPGGTGLGLYVTFGLVKAHGGKMKVQSVVGKGTTFIFTLPVYKAKSGFTHETSEKNMFAQMGLGLSKE